MVRKYRPKNEKIKRGVVSVYIDIDLIELARAKGLSLSDEVEDFLRHRLEMNSPVEKLQAEIKQAQIHLAALQRSFIKALEEEENVKRNEEILRPWIEYYRKRKASRKWPDTQQEEWVKEAAAKTRLKAEELMKILEDEK